MPALSISADVFARLWAVRRGGEETEEQILRRLLDLPEPLDSPGAQAPSDEDAAGFTDATYGVHFPDGFEIFRTYKGRPYNARVEAGRWRLDADGRSYDSLNQLSQAVIDGNENAWMFWFAPAPGGGRRRIADFRDPALVQKRPRRKPASAGQPRRRSAATAGEPAPAPWTRPAPVVEPPAKPRSGATGGLPWEAAKRR